jgi:hypothetical protein
MTHPNPAPAPLAATETIEEVVALCERAMTCLALELPAAVYDDAIEKLIRPAFRHLALEVKDGRAKAFGDAAAEIGFGPQPTKPLTAEQRDWFLKRLRALSHKAPGK